MRFAHWVTAMARLSGQCANRMAQALMSLRIRVWRAIEPRRRWFFAGNAGFAELARSGRSVNMTDWQSAAGLPSTPSQFGGGGQSEVDHQSIGADHQRYVALSP